MLNFLQSILGLRKLAGKHYRAERDLLENQDDKFFWVVRLGYITPRTKL